MVREVDHIPLAVLSCVSGMVKVWFLKYKNISSASLEIVDKIELSC